MKPTMRVSKPEVRQSRIWTRPGVWSWKWVRPGGGPRRWTVWGHDKAGQQPLEHLSAEWGPVRFGGKRSGGGLSRRPAGTGPGRDRRWCHRLLPLLFLFHPRCACSPWKVGVLVSASPVGMDPWRKCFRKNRFSLPPNFLIFPNWALPFSCLCFS